MATLLKANGEVIYGLTADTLDQKQEAVGGYIQLVPIQDKTEEFRKSILIVNEEGLLQGLPTNEKASILAGQHIVGDVLVVLKDSIE